jgi:hypothetical protein
MVVGKINELIERFFKAGHEYNLNVFRLVGTLSMMYSWHEEIGRFRSALMKMSSSERKA